MRRTGTLPDPPTGKEFRIGVLGGFRTDGACPPPLRVHARRMFIVTEADAAAIRTAMDEGGDLAAAVELRRRFPGITDNSKASANSRSASWPISVPMRLSSSATYLPT